MEIKLINCFSCVIPTIKFQRLKIFLASLLLFTVEYIFLETVCKIIDGKIYLLACLLACLLASFLPSFLTYLLTYIYLLTYLLPSFLTYLLTFLLACFLTHLLTYNILILHREVTFLKRRRMMKKLI